MGDERPIGLDAGRSEVWQSVPHAVVVADQGGVILAISPAAAALLPEAASGSLLAHSVPDWLALAHQDVTAESSILSSPTQRAGGPIDERMYTARPSLLPDRTVAWWLVDAGDEALQDAQHALIRERERASFLDETSAVLMASLNFDRCMEAIVQMAVRHLADAALVVAAVTGHRLPMVSSAPEGSVEQRTVVADPSEVPGLAEALRGFPPVPSRWLDPAALPAWLIPPHVAGAVGSVVVTPLPGHGIPAGALILLRRNSAAAFTEGEEVYARLFAQRAGAALSAARLYAEQSAITRTLMSDLLPPQLHQLHGFELAGGYRASEDHQLVGGDFYDVHPAESPEQETLIVLGDVCGKGLDAAVITGKIRNTLHALAPLADHHEGVLKLLNSALLSPDNSKFATVVLASVARRDGALMLRLTCAGHPAPLIVRNDGSVDVADTRGTLVGALPQFKSRSFETTLAPGETCLLYTDGLTEARGGPLGNELFGEERLSAALAQCAEMPAEAVVERIMMLASGWVSQREHDDMAVVAITSPHRNLLSAVDGHTAGRYTA